MNTYTDKAIQRASGAGYFDGKLRYKPGLAWGYEIKGNGFGLVSAFQILYDPFFWQALGRAQGNELEYIEFTIWRSISSSDIVKTIWWIAQWHMFIDHLAEGKKVDDFFKQLLK